MQKTYSVLGDSISTFKGVVPDENRWYYDAADTNRTGVTSPGQTWWMHVIEGEGGALAANASFSGSMVQGDGFPAACDPKRARQLRGADAKQPNVVLVFIGVNDYGWASPEAQFVGGSEAAPKHPAYDDLSHVDPAGPAPSDAVAKFARAYADMLANVRAVAPDAEVWCATIPPGRVSGNAESTFCYRLRGIDIDEYNDAIRAAAAASGARVADMAALGFDYDATDGTHPNEEGMRQLATLFRASMRHAAGDEAGRDALMQGYPRRLRSSRFCDKPSCVGCEFSAITPTSWSCVCRKQLDSE